MDGAHLMEEVMKKRQCSATSKRSGTRCRRPPIRGGSVCSMHGGAAPQVRLAAGERLAALVEPAIDALKVAIDCGDTNAAIRAAQLVLDRTGFHPTKANAGPNGERPFALTMNVGETRRAAAVGWVPIARLRTIAAWLSEAEAAMEAGEPKPLQNVERTALERRVDGPPSMRIEHVIIDPKDSA